ncbi:unnamed protein product, partial [Choristocarpus tenellus]
VKVTPNHPILLQADVKFNMKEKLSYECQNVQDRSPSGYTFCGRWLLHRFKNNLFWSAFRISFFQLLFYQLPLVLSLIFYHRFYCSRYLLKLIHIIIVTTSNDFDLF